MWPKYTRCYDVVRNACTVPYAVKWWTCWGSLCVSINAVLSLGNCVLEYYIMVTSSVSDLDLRRMQFLEVDVTGPRRFLCSKDRFDWDMACHACVSLWVLEFYFPTVYWSTYPQETDKHISPTRIGSNSMTLIDWTFHTQWPAVVLFSSATYLFSNYS